MKLPDRLVLKWLAKHPKFGQFLEKHYLALFSASLLISMMGTSASAYAFERNWLAISNISNWISTLGLLIILALSCVWFLNHVTQQEVDQLRNKEQNDAHP